MFRTRDFALVFTVIFFLIVAIGVTSLHKFLISPSSEIGELRPSTSLIEEYGVETTHSESSREATLEGLRNKIALDDSVITMPEPTTSSEEQPSDIIEDEEDSNIAQLCAGFRETGSVAWVPQDTYWQQVEGARILYERPYIESSAFATTSSSSFPVKDIARLQLPIIALPVSNPTCIATDVIGVALDGSLINNAEAKLYSVFGAETVIGYALDGFPIYGLSTESSDQCGGRIVSGQYRYELSKERTNIINCFAGMPQPLVYGNPGS